VKAARVDAADEASLAAALSGVDLVIICAPVRERVGGVAAAALHAGADVVDLNYAEAAWEALNTRQDQAVKRGCCVVGQAGLIPGVPALLARHAASSLGASAKVAIAEFVNVEEASAAASADLLRELKLTAPLYRGGAWRRPGGSGARRFDFGPPVGRRKCYPFDLPELRGLPARLELAELGQYAGGFGSAVVDGFFTIWLLLRLNRSAAGARAGGRMLRALQRRYAGPPYYTTLKLEAEAADGRQVEWFLGHDDGYEATAAAAAAAVRQLADGSARRPGVYLMGHLLDPGRFFEDAVALGVEVTEKFGGP
jgi:saccharopine dehydrogenase (NAD+, L-lysine-forming)